MKLTPLMLPKAQFTSVRLWYSTRIKGTIFWGILTLLLTQFAAGSAFAGDLPAFPGAEGYGARTTGGRGGRVIAVTNTNASGPGSLRAACEAEGPRICQFAG